jgi:hypothetical protein
VLVTAITTARAFRNLEAKRKRDPDSGEKSKSGTHRPTPHSEANRGTGASWIESEALVAGRNPIQQPIKTVSATERAKSLIERNMLPRAPQNNSQPRDNYWLPQNGRKTDLWIRLSEVTR